MDNYDKYLKYYTSKEIRPSFCIIDGYGNTMISAPHSVEQTRNGKEKYGEYQTGVLANILHDSIKCPIICKTHNYNDDANYDEESEYKDKLCEFVTNRNIKYLIDLHQLAPWREEEINIGTGRGQNIKEFPMIVEIIKKHFILNNINSISIDKPFDASYPFTVSSYVSSKCGITCIQIEINSKIVCKDFDECCFSSVKNSIEHIINELNSKEENI